MTEECRTSIKYASSAKMTSDSILNYYKHITTLYKWAITYCYFLDEISQSKIGQKILSEYEKGCSGGYWLGLYVNLSTEMCIQPDRLLYMSTSLIRKLLTCKTQAEIISFYRSTPKKGRECTKIYWSQIISVPITILWWPAPFHFSICTLTVWRWQNTVLKRLLYSVHGFPTSNRTRRRGSRLGLHLIPPQYRPVFHKSWNGNSTYNYFSPSSSSPSNFYCRWLNFLVVDDSIYTTRLAMFWADKPEERTMQ